MTWRSQFGGDWAVPLEITGLVKAGLLKDISDSTFDELPVFAAMFPDRSIIQVVVDHANPARRVFPEDPRFFVQWLRSAGGVELGAWGSDDAGAVARLLRTEIHSGTATLPPRQAVQGRRWAPYGPEEWRPIRGGRP